MDNRPKRRKSKDNPYKLECNKELNIYKVTFKDSKGILRIIEINKEMYETLDSFELDDLSQMNKYERHIEFLEQDDNNLYMRSVDKGISIDEIIDEKIKLEKLKIALDKLTPIQKEKIKNYYFDNMSMEQIAEKFGCSHQAISKSLRAILKELEKNLKNLKF